MRNRQPFIKFLLSIVGAAYCLSAGATVKPDKIAKQKWFEASTSNFIVLTDKSEKAAIELAQNLERFRVMLELFTGSEIDRNLRPVKLIATKRVKTYRFLYGKGDGVRRTTGFFRDTLGGNYSALRLFSRSRDYNLSTVLHEYTHYLTANLAASNMPFWYNEGLAEFLGETQFKTDKVIHYGRPVIHHLENMAQTPWMPLDELLNTNHISHKKSRKRYKIYSQGWLLVHYLASNPEIGTKRDTFLKLLVKGVSPEEAVQSAFNFGIKELNAKLKNYKRGPFYYSQITLKSPIDIGQIKVRRLAPQEVAYEIGEFVLQGRGHFGDARPFFETALSITPDYADALAGLANTYLGSDQAKMMTYVEKAKAIDKANPWVATISGHLHSWQMRTGESERGKKRILE